MGKDSFPVIFMSSIPESVINDVKAICNMAGKIDNRKLNQISDELSEFCECHDVTVYELAKMIRKGVYSFTYCKVCSKRIDLGRVYCSASCRNNDKDWQDKFKLISLEKYGTEWPSSSQSIKDKVKQACLDHYNVEYAIASKEVRNQIKDTNLVKYGVENVFQSAQIKEKIRLTNIEKYGYSNHLQSPEIKAIAQNTMMDRYGVTVPAKNPLIAQRIKNTKIKRYGEYFYRYGFRDAVQRKYGVENISQLPIWKEKFRRTSRQRYGKDHPNQSKTISKKIIRTRRAKHFFNFVQSIRTKGYVLLSPIDVFIDYSKTIALQHSCGKIIHTTSRIVQKLPVCSCIKIHHRSYAEDEIFEYISNIVQDEVVRNDRSVLEGMELDIYIPSRKIAIEYNGCYWHSEEYTSRNYHKHKTDVCESKGINLLHIFEWDWINNKRLVQQHIGRMLDAKTEIKNYSVTITDEVITLFGDDAVEIASLVYDADNNIVLYNNISMYNDAVILSILMQHVDSKSIQIKFDRSCNTLSTTMLEYVLVEDTAPQPYYVKRRKLVTEIDDYEYVVYGTGYRIVQKRDK